MVQILSYDSGSSSGTESSSAILRVARELCLRFDVKPLPERFLWRKPSFIFRFRSDEVLFLRKVLALSAHLQDKLSPEEWKPLMMSSLIISKKWKYRNASRYILNTIAAESFAIIPGAGLLTLLEFPRYALGLYLLLVLFLIPWTLYAQQRRVLRLEADLKVSEMLGKQVLVEVLEKIDSLHPRDIEKSKKIANLKNILDQANHNKKIIQSEKHKRD